MKLTPFYSFLFLLALASCKEEQKPKVIYNSTPSKVEVKKDTSTLEVADLPIQFQNSTVLLYPIGELKVSELRKGSYDSEKYNNAGFTVSTMLENEMTGYLRNIKFQQIGSDSLHVLTNKMVMIERASYLKSKKIMVYVLADADTNQDSTIDSDDIKSLYLSTDMGKNFTKVSPEIQELIDWNVIETTNTLYFRTIEDANKNGAFDKKDKLHYFSIALTKDWTATEFMPLK